MFHAILGRQSQIRITTTCVGAFTDNFEPIASKFYSPMSSVQVIAELARGRVARFCIVRKMCSFSYTNHHRRIGKKIPIMFARGSILAI